MGARTYLAMAIVMAGASVGAFGENHRTEGFSTLSNITTLELNIGSLDVSIMSTDEDTISWKLRGIEQQLSHRVEDGKLILIKKKIPLPSLRIVTDNTKSNQSIVSINGIIKKSVKQVSTTCDGGCREPHLSIYIPESVAIDFNAYKGFATVESIKSHLSFFGTGALEVGTLSHASLDLKGNAKVSAGIVRGSIFSTLKGNSILYIHTGYIPQADLTLSGNSKFSFGGDIDQLSVDGAGNSSVNISHANAVNRVRSSGNATVCVKSLAEFSNSCS